LHTRFRRGKSGNPRGRPRGAKNFSTLLTDASNEPVVVTKDGRRRKISKRELGFKQLANKFAMAEAQATSLGHNPSLQILCVSYAQDLADKLARNCRRIVMSDWYQRPFPARLSPRHQAVPEFETTRQGGCIATRSAGC
jgi:hypothetical protein